MWWNPGYLLKSFLLYLALVYTNLLKATFPLLQTEKMDWLFRVSNVFQENVSFYLRRSLTSGPSVIFNVIFPLKIANVFYGRPIMILRFLKTRWRSYNSFKNILIWVVHTDQTEKSIFMIKLSNFIYNLQYIHLCVRHHIDHTLFSSFTWVFGPDAFFICYKLALCWILLDIVT